MTARTDRPVERDTDRPVETRTDRPVKRRTDRPITTALLVGGSSEIGLAILRELVVGGLRGVVLAGRDRAALDRAADTLRAEGVPTVHAVDLDAADSPEVMVAAMGRGRDLLGGLDLVCVCLGRLDPAGAPTPAGVADVVRVGFLAPAVTALAAADILAAQGHGHLVVLSSLTAAAPRPALLAYGAAKAGLDAFSVGLADRLRGSGVSVLVVRPAQVRTRMSAHLPNRPLTVDAGDVAHAVRRAITDGRSVAWVPATGRVAAAVLGLLPRAILRRLPA